VQVRPGQATLTSRDPERRGARLLRRSPCGAAFRGKRKVGIAGQGPLASAVPGAAVRADGPALRCWFLWNAPRGVFGKAQMQMQSAPAVCTSESAKREFPTPPGRLALLRSSGLLPVPPFDLPGSGLTNLEAFCSFSKYSRRRLLQVTQWYGWALVPGRAVRVGLDAPEDGTPFQAASSTGRRSCIGWARRVRCMAR